MTTHHEMIISIEETHDMYDYLQWLRFQSKRLKVPEHEVFMALVREWKRTEQIVVIARPRKRVGEKKDGISEA